MNIPTPAQYKTASGKTGFNIANVKHWDNEIIRRIIKNEMYMGI